MNRILKVLSHSTPQAILGLLGTRPLSARQAAGLTGLPLPEVHRWLRRMEAAGLIEGAWTHMGDPTRLYALAAKAIHIRPTASGLRVELERPTGAMQRGSLEPDPWEGPVPGFLLGRRDLLENARQRRLLLLTGPAGIGKSAIMANLSASDEGGVFSHTFQGPETLDWLRARLCAFLVRNDAPDALELARGPTSPSLFEHLLGLLDRPQNTIVLDDVDRIEDQDVRAFVLELAERATAMRVRLSARQWEDPVPDDFHLMEVPGLSLTPATRLLGDAGRADPEGAAALVHATEGNPLALHVGAAVAKLTKKGLKQVAQELPAGDWDALLDALRGAMDADLLRAMEAASVVGCPFRSVDLARMDTGVATSAVAALRRMELLVEHGHGVYAMHPLLAEAFCPDGEHRARLHKGAVDVCMRRKNIPSFVAALGHAAESDEPDQALAMIRENLETRAFPLIEAGHGALYGRLLAALAAQTDPGDALTARIHIETGDLAEHNGDSREALQSYLQAIAWYRDHEEKVPPNLLWRQAKALGRMGGVGRARRSLEAEIQALADGGGKARLQHMLRELEDAAADLQ